MRVLSIVAICILFIVFTYFQFNNDNSSYDSDNSPNDNDKLKKAIRYASILAVLGFVGPYIVDYFGNLEENQEEVFSDTAEDEDTIPQDMELVIISEKKNIFAMEMNSDKLFKEAPEAKDLAEPVQVPNVVGLSKEKARDSLERAGLKAVEKEEYSDTVEAGLVISQSVDGEKAEIEIMISKGEEQTPTPEPPNSSNSGSSSQGMQGGQSQQEQPEPPVVTQTPEPPVVTQTPEPTVTPEPTPKPDPDRENINSWSEVDPDRENISEWDREK